MPHDDELLSADEMWEAQVGRGRQLCLDHAKRAFQACYANLTRAYRPAELDRVLCQLLTEHAAVDVQVHRAVRVVDCVYQDLPPDRRAEFRAELARRWK